MHVITLVHSDPRNFKPFEKWVNSRDYGSRAFCREFRLYDINIQEAHLPNLLGDLKHYYKGNMIAAYKKNKLIKRIINFVRKRLKLKEIDMDSVEKTPKKWFTGINCGPNTCHATYLYPLGGFPDIKDKYGHEEI